MAEESKAPSSLKEKILAELKMYHKEGRDLDKTLFEHIAAKLQCSMRYVYTIHKEHKESFAKTIQKPIQSLSKFADIEKMLQEGIEDVTVEEVTAIPPLAKPEEKKPEEEEVMIPLTEDDVRGLVGACNIWVTRMLPPELSKDEIKTLAKVWTPVLNKMMPQWGAEIIALITTGIVFAPRIYERAKKVQEKRKEEGETLGEGYGKFV